MKLLMHICCANCSLYPIRELASEGIFVTGLWFNPNIHPHTEYTLRLDAVRHLSRMWGLDVEYVDHYGLRDFLRMTSNDIENRCERCYRMRLEETAKKAKELEMDAFTTSMLVSPYQKFDIIVDAGKRMQDKYSVEFFMQDFRPGYKKGVELSKELGLYRQKYCGCIFSEEERYMGKKNHDRE